jgi:hypothetical protein
MRKSRWSNVQIWVIFKRSDCAIRIYRESRNFAVGLAPHPPIPTRGEGGGAISPSPRAAVAEGLRAYRGRFFVVGLVMPPLPQAEAVWQTTAKRTEGAHRSPNSPLSGLGFA